MLRLRVIFRQYFIYSFTLYHIPYTLLTHSLMVE